MGVRSSFVCPSRFRMAKFVPPPSWIFEILTVGTVKSVEVHVRAKFCQNRSNRG